MGYSATCGKCDGKGKIWAFGHIENGDCFWCHGSGKLNFRGAAPTAIESAREHASYGFGTVAMAVRDGNLDRARFYARHVAENLFIAGTSNALTILNGTAYDHDTDERLPLSVCRAAAKIIVDVGKEMAGK